MQPKLGLQPRFLKNATIGPKAMGVEKYSYKGKKCNYTMICSRVLNVTKARPIAAFEQNAAIGLAFVGV